MSILDREDSVYITVRVGDGQCQQAIPREVITKRAATEQWIGALVLKQLRAVDSILAVVKEKKDAQDT